MTKHHKTILRNTILDCLVQAAPQGLSGTQLHRALRDKLPHFLADLPITPLLVDAQRAGDIIATRRGHSIIRTAAPHIIQARITMSKLPQRPPTRTKASTTPPVETPPAAPADKHAWVWLVATSILGILIGIELSQLFL